MLVPSQREVTHCIGEKLYLGCKKYRSSQAQTLMLFVSEEDSGLFNIHFTWQGPTSLSMLHLHVLAVVDICADLLQESLPNAHLRLRTSLMLKSSKPARVHLKRHPCPANLQDRASRLLK